MQPRPSVTVTKCFPANSPFAVVVFVPDGNHEYEYAPIVFDPCAVAVPFAEPKQSVLVELTVIVGSELIATCT